MSHWADIRAQAREQHQILLAESNGDASATALLSAAARITNVHPEPLPPGDSLLGDAIAVLDRAAQSIFYNQGTEPLLVPLLLGHEYAHLWLGHTDCARCSAEQVDAEASDEDVPLGVARVQGYSPEERREREANVYARELLLPCDVMRQWYLNEGIGAAEIAARTGLPEGMVFHQLSFALLTPEPEPATGRGEDDRARAGLDESQRDAAFEPEGPVLVEAGPGTGKTRTLVARVEYLLGPERRVSPDSILCLTFSIKAAEEMRERIAHVAPAEAVQMQIGTFHSFGLEQLRRYGHYLGYPPRPRVLDPAAALFLLERMLPELRLVHYQNLYEPTTNLRDLLGAISRAKDELRTPADYERLASQMLTDAGDDEEKVLRAERALEVARVYKLYQEHLDREKILDFGDLIFRTVELLQKVPGVRKQLGAQYQHILVDEYQDVNRASGALVEELAMESGGHALWVVGDPRQSIYRWRGASSANMRLFREKFPETKVKILTVNYRSKPAIVDLVSAFVPQMKVESSLPFTPWEANREAAGEAVQMEIAEDSATEAMGIAREIERRHTEEHIPYRDHAVLCRSHTQLARIAAGLERAGIPVLYLGDLFERPEIRDMLSVLALACQGSGYGLVRVARFPDYQVPLADVLAVLAAATERGVPFPRALELVEAVDGLSKRGREGLQLLSAHLADLCYGTTAWGMLAHYLFNRSGYIRHLARDGSVAAQQKRLALYQFLEFAHQNREPDAGREVGDPKRALLEFVRRLEVFGEEKQLRNLPEAAGAIDAVRLLTVHGSKGLQFPVVFVPGLGAGFFPANRQYVACPDPDGLVVGGTGDSHDEEEECLFFVAISRAENVLCLSRAEMHGKKKSNPSRLLVALERHLPRKPGIPATWRRETAAESEEELAVPATQQTFEEKALDAYLRCPRQYYYERVLGLGGLRDDAVYAELHKCVYQVVGWLQAERTEGRIPDVASALAKLAEVWKAHGPVDHPYEEMYREGAESMVRQAMRELTAAGATPHRPEWEIERPYGRIRFTPDHLVVAGPNLAGAATVFRLRTGRLSSKELEKPIYGLYQAAFAAAYPGQAVDVHALSLSTGERKPVDLKPGPVETRLKKYDVAITGILREDFPPEPRDERQCPRCPHYFICPIAENE